MESNNKGSLEQMLTSAIVSQVMAELKLKGDVITRGDAEDIIKSSDERILGAVNTAIGNANQTISKTLANFRQEISDRITKQIDTQATRIIEIRDYRLVDENGNPRVLNVGKQHPKFEELMILLRCRLPVYVFGPTGSGKTYAIKIVAEKVLNIPFYRKVMSSQSSESSLLGYANSAGEYVKGIAFDAYKDGGVLLIDEIDNGNANVNTVIKMLNDGDSCYFPVIGNISKHKNFYLIANANTTGDGATRQYVGRAPQDKAMLNTFAFLEWGYDTEFERSLALEEFKSSGGIDEKEFEQAINEMWRLRAAANELKLDYIMSTRNILYAIRLYAQHPKPTKEQLQLITRSTILRGCPKEQFIKIVEKANTMRAVVRAGEVVRDVEVTLDKSPF